MTPLDLITAAAQDLGALALEETLSAGEAQAGLNALNDLLDAWNTESLLVYSISPQVFTLTAGQTSYAFGAGGDFNAPRPNMIEDVYMRSVNQGDIPMAYTTDYRDYANIIQKNYTSSIPVLVYDDTNFPQRNLYFYPIPDGTINQVVIWSTEILANITDLNAAISLPPAYTRAIKKNLAMELAPAFGAKPSQILIQQAIDSKMQLERLNINVPELSTPFDRRYYNINTGFSVDYNKI